MIKTLSFALVVSLLAANQAHAAPSNFKVNACSGANCDALPAALKALAQKAEAEKWEPLKIQSEYRGYIKGVLRSAQEGIYNWIATAPPTSQSAAANCAGNEGFAKVINCLKGVRNSTSDPAARDSLDRVLTGLSSGEKAVRHLVLNKLALDAPQDPTMSLFSSGAQGIIYDIGHPAETEQKMMAELNPVQGGFADGNSTNGGKLMPGGTMLGKGKKPKDKDSAQVPPLLLDCYKNFHNLGVASAGDPKLYSMGAEETQCRFQGTGVALFSSNPAFMSHMTNMSVQTYLDVLRLDAIGRVLLGYRKVQGKSMKSVPAECKDNPIMADGIDKYINTPLTEEEKEEAALNQDPERLRFAALSIKARAAEAAEVEKEIEDGQASISDCSSSKSGDTLSDKLKVDVEACGRAKSYRAKASDLEQKLLKMNGEIYDQIQENRILGVGYAPKSKVSIHKNLPPNLDYYISGNGKGVQPLLLNGLDNSAFKALQDLCKSEKDGGVSWKQLVKNKELSKSLTDSDNRLSWFKSVQQCAEERIDKQESNAKTLAIMNGASCAAFGLAAPMIFGPLCAGYFGAESFQEHAHAERAMAFQQNCISAAGNSVCSKEDYFAAVEKFDDAMKSVALNAIFAGAEAGAALRSIKQLSKAMDAKQLSGYAKALDEIALSGNKQALMKLEQSMRAKKAAAGADEVVFASKEPWKKLKPNEIKDARQLFESVKKSDVVEIYPGSYVRKDYAKEIEINGKKTWVLKSQSEIEAEGLHLKKFDPPAPVEPTPPIHINPEGAAAEGEFVFVPPAKKPPGWKKGDVIVPDKIPKTEAVQVNGAWMRKSDAEKIADKVVVDGKETWVLKKSAPPYKPETPPVFQPKPSKGGAGKSIGFNEPVDGKVMIDEMPWNKFTDEHMFNTVPVDQAVKVKNAEGNWIWVRKDRAEQKVVNGKPEWVLKPKPGYDLPLPPAGKQPPPLPKPKASAPKAPKVDAGDTVTVFDRPWDFTNAQMSKQIPKSEAILVDGGWVKKIHAKQDASGKWIMKSKEEILEAEKVAADEAEPLLLTKPKPKSKPSSGFEPPPPAPPQPPKAVKAPLPPEAKEFEYVSGPKGFPSMHRPHSNGSTALVSTLDGNKNKVWKVQEFDKAGKLVSERTLKKAFTPTEALREYYGLPVK